MGAPFLALPPAKKGRTLVQQLESEVKLLRSKSLKELCPVPASILLNLDKWQRFACVGLVYVKVSWPILKFFFFH